MNLTFSNISNEVVLTVARDPSKFPKSKSFFLKPSETNTTKKTREYLRYHCYTRTSNHTSVNFEMNPNDYGIDFKVYLKKGRRPNLRNGDYDFMFQLPDLSSCKVGDKNLSQAYEEGHGEDQAIVIEPKNCSRHLYTVFLSNTDLNGTGQFCFGEQKCEWFIRFYLKSLFLLEFTSVCFYLNRSFPPYHNIAFRHSTLNCLKHVMHGSCLTASLWQRFSTPMYLFGI